MTENRKAIWSKLLEEFDDEIVLMAALQIIAQGREWPPNIGDLRTMCVRMSHGEIEEPSATESWGRVFARATGGKEPLREIDRKILERLGMTVRTVAESTAVGVDRAHFMKAFDEYVRSRSIQRNTPAATMRAIQAIGSEDLKCLPVPVPESKQLTAPETPVSTEEIEQLINVMKAKMAGLPAD